MKPGETAYVTAQGFTLEGHGVAPLGERELHCARLFPAESAEVRITALSRHHPRAHGELVRLAVPHPERRAAPCPAHVAREGRCAGCALMELSEGAQRELKRAMLRERFGLDVERVEPSPEPLGYRWSSKRVAFGRVGALSLGSFARGSHTPSPMDGCLVDHPSLVEAFAEITRKANALAIEPFDERGPRGDLRYVWAKTNGAEVIVTLVVAQEGGRAETELATQLDSTGVLVSVQEALSNALRGGAPKLVRGQAELIAELLGERVEVGALGFLQPNPRAAEVAYRALLGDPVRGELAFDLYAGAGVTTRVLRTRFREVIACEAYPESANALGIVPQDAAEFLAAWLPKRAGRIPELVIANPPRKGMGPNVCALLGELGPREVRIMSCGPAGLARDLHELCTRGYELTTLQAFDTLPQTPHVELVATLTLPP